MTKPDSNKKRNLLLLIAAILLFVGNWREIKALPYTFASPSSKLTQSIEKLNSYKTVYMEYEMEGTTRLTSRQEGITKKIDFLVKGYISGQSDGETASNTIEISSPLNPSGSIIVNILTTEKYTYLKGPATGGKWIRMTNDKFQESDEASTTDGSMYPFVMLSSIISEDNALLSSIDKNSVKLVRSDGVFKVYSVDISVPEYITALKLDKENSGKDISDAREILKDAIVTAEIYVNKDTHDVASIDLVTKHLAQIQTDETKVYGIDSVHDAVTHIEFSRLGLPLDIKEPTDFVEDAKDTDEVLGASIKKILKTN